MRPEDTQRLFNLYPVLTRLSPGVRAHIASGMQLLRAGDGHDLFTVSDRCSGLPLIASGGVRVIKPLQNGRVLPLYRLGPGDLCVVSVSCLLGDVVYPAGARAAGDVAGGVLPAPVFRMLMDEEQAFRHEVFGLVASRLCVMLAHLEEIAVTRMHERLADLLVSRGPVVRATHQALADELGTAREVVSRILEHFEAEGHVRLRRAHVDVLDPRRLAVACTARSLD